MLKEKLKNYKNYIFLSLILVLLTFIVIPLSVYSLVANNNQDNYKYEDSNETKEVEEEVLNKVNQQLETSEMENIDEPENNIEYLPIKYYIKDDINPIYVENEKHQYMDIQINSNDLIGYECQFEVKLKGTANVVYEQTIQVKSLMTVEDFYLDAGDYETTLTCITEENTYQTKKEFSILLTGNSICDSKEFLINSSEYSYSELSSSLVGKWKGCTSNPWEKPYQVEFSFDEKGNYTSKNIEMVNNPTTTRRSSALYYGIDSPAPGQTYSIQNGVNSNVHNGYINISFLKDSENLVKDTLQNIKMSDDGKTLYFEMIHLGQYGPIKYILDRQSE